MSHGGTVKMWFCGWVSIVFVVSVLVGDGMTAERNQAQSDVWGEGRRRAEIRSYETRPVSEMRARVLFNPITKKEEVVVNSYRDWGCLLLTLKRYDEALDKFHEACKLAPKDVRAKVCTGHALYALGRIREAEITYRSVPNSRVADLLVERIRKDPRKEAEQRPPGLHGLVEMAIPEMRARCVKALRDFLEVEGAQAIDEDALDRVLVDNFDKLVERADREIQMEAFLGGWFPANYIWETGRGFLRAGESMFNSYKEDYRREIACFVAVSAGVLAEMTVMAIEGDRWKDQPPRITVKLGHAICEAQLKDGGDFGDIGGLLGLMNRVVESTGDPRRFGFSGVGEGDGWITFLRPEQFTRLKKGIDYENRMWKVGCTGKRER